MKKSIKRIVTLCLAVIMLVSVMSVSSFACTNQTAKTYKSYAVIGDSIAAGYGLPSYTSAAVARVESINADLTKYEGQAEFYVYDNHRIEGSFSDIVADEIGVDTLYTLAHCGFRSTEIRAILDNTYDGDDYTSLMLSRLANLSEEEFDALTEQYVEAIKNSDMITINCGSNDTMTYALEVLSTELNSDSSEKSPLITEAENELVNGSFGAAFEKLFEYAQTADKLTKALTLLEKAMIEGYVNFQINLTQIVKIIHQLNPDADIYVVGMYNPFNNTTLTDDTMLKVGKLADTVVGLMNAYMSNGCPQSANYRYVDVMGAEAYEMGSLSSMEIGGWAFIKNVHPNENGHKFIAQQIINAVNENSEETDNAIGNAVQNTTSIVKGTISNGIIYNAVKTFFTRSAR